jgi:hypothetical protein
MHLTLIFRPIFIFRVSPFQNTLRKLSLLSANGHPHDRLFGILYPLGQISRFRLSSFSPFLFLLSREGQIDLADIHCLMFRLKMGVFSLHDVLRFVCRLQGHFGLLLQ